MSSIGVNPPRTPVTEGSGDKSPATLPNVCKMPGPPAPFVPTPLPNIGQSSDKLSDCTSTVKFEGKKVAIKGSYYMSKLSGDMASKGTGGGIISATTEGKTKFVAPGSMNVKAEGKNIQLLGDGMSNNGSNPYNAATLPGNFQSPAAPTAGIQKIADELCDQFCDFGKKKKWKNCRSSDLEAKVRNNRNFTNRGGGWRVAIAESQFPRVAASTAARFSRSAIALTGKGVMVLVRVIPDALLMRGSRIVQCFDFKFPDDYWRRDQYERQRRLAGGRRPLTICRETCGC